jgi:hypothetical protein
MPLNPQIRDWCGLSGVETQSLLVSSVTPIYSRHAKDFHDFIAEVVDDFDGNAA